MMNITERILYLLQKYEYNSWYGQQIPEEELPNEYIHQSAERIAHVA